ncbi:MAG: DUF4349 domain-containing protein [Myxococcales bacterium]|nr:DUF4349 domain-containing protein [Myxococcales bacterium]
MSLVWHILLSTQVAACSPLQESQTTYQEVAESTDEAVADRSFAEEDSDEYLGTETATTSPRQLAYEYSAHLSLPNSAVAKLAQQHENRCQEAGIKVCQVISSSVRERGPDFTHAELELRAARPWMTSFREGLVKEANAVAGQLRAMTAHAEELTRVMTDTTARLQAQQTLRERLMTLLALETDDIGNLLQIERELARVQSEIESAKSQLRQLRDRVAMDRITLRYDAMPKAVSSSATEPVIEALTTFFSTLSHSVALLILFVAGALPWVVVGLPCLWIFVRLLQSMLKSRQPNSAPPNKVQNPQSYEDLTPEPSLD